MCPGYCSLSLLLKWNAVQETLEILSSDDSTQSCHHGVHASCSRLRQVCVLSLAESHPESQRKLESQYMSKIFHHGTFNRTTGTYYNHGLSLDVLGLSPSAQAIAGSIKETDRAASEITVESLILCQAWLHEKWTVTC